MKKKMCIVTTIPSSLNFFRGQLGFLGKLFDITAISSGKKQLEEFGCQENVNVHCIPMKREISLLKDGVGLIRFIGYFSKVRPYLVHGNTPKGALLSLLAAKLVRIPKRVYMCHGLRYQGTVGLMKRLLMVMEKITCKCATEVLCVSQGVREQLDVDNICGKSKSKVILNGSANGINMVYFDKCRLGNLSDWKIKLGITRDDFVFSFVGRVVRDKGVNELVYAFDKLSILYPDRISLLIVGPEEDSLDPISDDTRNILKKNLRIHLLGRQTDVRPYMAVSDVFLLPSYREGFGQVLMEAGALGVPCITTDIIGCNEIIQDGINGKIIPPRDENALYEAMKWFYEHREDEVKRMAGNARPMIAERYEQHKVWEALLKEYQSL